MSDDQSWQVPSGAQRPILPAPQAGSWQPPPKPGLIPLRPLDVGTLLGASFRVIRRNPKPTFGVALLVQLFSTVIPFIFGGAIAGAALLRIDSAIAADQDAIVAGAVGLGLVTMLLTVVLSVVANAWLQGILVLEVARGALGEKLTLRQLWSRARGRFGALIGWALLLAGALLLSIGLLFGIIVILVVAFGPVGVGLAVLFGILGGLGMLVLAVWLGVKVSLVPSALVLERLPLRQAVLRSWRLTNQSFWRTFGVQALVWLILSIASSVVTAPFSIIAPLMIVLIDPNGTGSEISIILTIAIYGLQLLVAVVVGAITAVIQTASNALIYLDLRMRKEGLDLALVKHVEARQAGVPSDGAELPDPYLPVGTLTTA